jgi:hypothetical protein
MELIKKDMMVGTAILTTKREIGSLSIISLR